MSALSWPGSRRSGVPSGSLWRRVRAEETGSPGMDSPGASANRELCRLGIGQACLDLGKGVPERCGD